MFTDLNASNYSYSEAFYNAEFELLLSKIIACYNLMVDDDITLTNNENSIRDVILINYLKNNSIRNRLELTDYIFDREVPEDTTRGRTDIKVSTQNTFKDTSAYYIIECKRLDGVNPTSFSSLNSKYIEEGINRFVTKAYSAHYRTNGMIGFVVSPMDIDKNISSINTLLDGKANTTKMLFGRQIVPDFEFSYCSAHTVDSNEMTLYHLMFDFSKNII